MQRTTTTTTTVYGLFQVNPGELAPENDASIMDLKWPVVGWWVSLTVASQGVTAGWLAAATQTREWTQYLTLKVLRRMHFLPQPSQFIQAWDQLTLCWVLHTLAENLQNNIVTHYRNDSLFVIIFSSAASGYTLMFYVRFYSLGEYSSCIMRYCILKASFV